jgi:hypothetical protein
MQKNLSKNGLVYKLLPNAENFPLKEKSCADLDIDLWTRGSSSASPLVGARDLGLQATLWQQGASGQRLLHAANQQHNRQAGR